LVRKYKPFENFKSKTTPKQSTLRDQSLKGT